MSWRDDIEALAAQGNIAAAMELVDALWQDRERLQQLNTAYLQHIAELKGGKPAAKKAVVEAAGQTGGLELSFRRLVVACEEFFGRAVP